MLLRVGVPSPSPCPLLPGPRRGGRRGRGWGWRCQKGRPVVATGGEGRELGDPATAGQRTALEGQPAAQLWTERGAPSDLLPGGPQRTRVAVGATTTLRALGPIFSSGTGWANLSLQVREEEVRATSTNLSHLLLWPHSAPLPYKVMGGTQQFFALAAPHHTALPTPAWAELPAKTNATGQHDGPQKEQRRTGYRQQETLGHAGLSPCLISSQGPGTSGVPCSARPGPTCPGPSPRAAAGWPRGLCTPAAPELHSCWQCCGAAPSPEPGRLLQPPGSPQGPFSEECSRTVSLAVACRHGAPSSPAGPTPDPSYSPGHP